MHNAHFAHLQYLYFLVIVVPAAIALWYANFQLRQKARRSYGERRLVDRYTRKATLASEILELVAWTSSLALLVVAAAGPMVQDTPRSAHAGSLQVVVLMDVSKSMHAEDYRNVMPTPDGSPGVNIVGPHGSRLDMARRVIESKIMPAITGNQLGVVTYAGAGFEQAPLTDDFNALRFVLDNWITVTNPAAPGGGSYMADGMLKATDTFARRADPHKQQVLVIFSDGGCDNKLSELDEALGKIKSRNIKVIIVGLGSTTPQLIPEYTEGGDGLLHYTGSSKKDGKDVTTSYEPSVLEHVRSVSGGDIIHLQSEQDMNVEWASKIAGSKTDMHESPVYQYPLAAALALLILLSLKGIWKRNDIVMR